MISTAVKLLPELSVGSVIAEIGPRQYPRRADRDAHCAGGPLGRIDVLVRVVGLPRSRNALFSREPIGIGDGYRTIVVVIGRCVDVPAADHAHKQGMPDEPSSTIVAVPVSGPVPSPQSIW